MATLNKSILSCNESTKRFFEAIYYCRNLVTLKALYQEDVDVNVEDSKGYSPLLLACLSSRKKVVDLLINAGANVYCKFMDGMTLLHFASKKGWTKLVQTLVKKWPNLDERNLRGETAMFIAARAGHLKIVKCLIEEGADIDLKNCDGVPPVLIAAEFSSMDVVDLLLNSRVNVDGCEGMILYYASGDGYTKLVQSLVKRIPNLNERYESGQTALHIASKYGHLETVKCLVEEGTDINTRNQDEETALHLASKNGHLEVVKFLVEKGSKNFYLDAKNTCGVTALGDACLSRKLDIARYLLQAGARWDIESEDGNSPFNYVTRKKEPEFKFIELFIESGAYFKPGDYEAIVECSSLKVLQDVELCCSAIVNKYNNHDLPELFKTLASGSLPCIEKMKIASNSEVVQAIKQSVRFEVQTKGHCNVLEVRPMALSVFSVIAVLEYRKKKKSELRYGLKRPAAFDPSIKCQHANKVMCLS